MTAVSSTKSSVVFPATSPLFCDFHSGKNFHFFSLPKWPTKHKNMCHIFHKPGSRSSIKFKMEQNWKKSRCSIDWHEIWKVQPPFIFCRDLNKIKKSESPWHEKDKLTFWACKVWKLRLYSLWGKPNIKVFAMAGNTSLFPLYLWTCIMGGGGTNRPRALSGLLDWMLSGLHLCQCFWYRSLTRKWPVCICMLESDRDRVPLQLVVLYILSSVWKLHSVQL